MKSHISPLGSARASRADCGASPQSILFPVNQPPIFAQKFAMATAPSPAREARALPKTYRHLVRFVIAFYVATFAACETANYIPPVTSQMAESNSRTGKHVDTPALERGRTLLVHRCIECHTLPPIWKYSSEDWPKIVNSMSHRASLKPEDRDAVVAYILAVRASEH